MRFANISSFSRLSLYKLTTHPTPPHPTPRCPFSAGDQIQKPKLCTRQARILPLSHTPSLFRRGKVYLSPQFHGVSCLPCFVPDMRQKHHGCQRVWHMLPASWWPGSRIPQRKGPETLQRHTPVKSFLQSAPSTAEFLLPSKIVPPGRDQPFSTGTYGDNPTQVTGVKKLVKNKLKKERNDSRCFVSVESTSEDSTRHRSHILKMIVIALNNTEPPPPHCLLQGNK